MKIKLVFIFIFFIKFIYADIPVDENGINLDSPVAFNLLPWTLGVLFAIGLSIAYFTYKNERHAAK